MEPLDDKTKRVLDVLAVLIVITVVLVLFLPVFLDLVWHYLICAWCMTGCILCLVRGRRRTACAAAALSALVAAAGFFLVYENVFRASGKTFTDYVTKYGIFTLPVFLLPIISLMLVSKVNEKKEDTLRGKHHGKL